MSKRRNYMAPFWWTLVLALIQVGMLVYLFAAMSDSPINKRIMISSVLPYQVAEILVLVAEAIIYWCIRKWQYRRSFAKWHVGLLYAGLWLPLLLFFILQFSSLFISAEAHSKTLAILKDAREIFYWSCIVIAHIFFVAAIVEGRKTRRKEETSNTDILEPV